MKIIFFFLLAVMTSNLRAQKQASVWYFGNMAAMDFRGGAPIAISGGQTDGNMSTITASICDSAGNPLFYTDGRHVFNRQNERMANGAVDSEGESLIVPFPGSDHLYYLFFPKSVDSFLTPPYSDTTNTGLRYAVVDMNLNGGLGDVVSKDSILFKNSFGLITAVHHANKKDVWVVAHEGYNNIYRIFLITENGINRPIRIPIGDVNPGSQIKFSPDGERLGAVFSDNTQNAKIQLYDFDNTSGALSNPVTIPYKKKSKFMYGLEFSPTGNFVYFTDNSSLYGDGPSYLLQLDTHDSDATPEVIATIPENLAYLQLALDGKIYVSHCTSSPLTRSNIGCVNKPTLKGNNCEFNLRQLDLSPGYFVTAGSVSFIQSYFFVEDPRLKMPNVFTPDQDTINATFRPASYDFINQASIVIVDQLGQQVFYSDDILHGWDGSGKLNGIYFWFVRYNGKNGKTGSQHGWVDLVR